MEKQEKQREEFDDSYDIIERSLKDLKEGEIYEL